MTVAEPAARPADGTRARLLAAAHQVFAERGYDRAGVQEIARRAGLTTGAIYGRFTGKAELLQEAIEAASIDEFDELFAQHRFAGRATDLLDTVGAHLVTREESDPDRALLLEAFVAARRDPEVAAAVRAVVAQRAARMAELVEASKASGDIDPELDTLSLVRFCHAVGLGFLLIRTLNLDLPDAEPWHDLISRLVGTLAPPSTPIKEQ